MRVLLGNLAKTLIEDHFKKSSSLTTNLRLPTKPPTQPKPKVCKIINFSGPPPAPPAPAPPGLFPLRFPLPFAPSPSSAPPAAPAPRAQASTCNSHCEGPAEAPEPWRLRRRATDEKRQKRKDLERLLYKTFRENPLCCPLHPVGSLFSLLHEFEIFSWRFLASVPRSDRRPVESDKATCFDLGFSRSNFSSGSFTRNL